MARQLDFCFDYLSRPYSYLANTQLPALEDGYFPAYHEAVFHAAFAEVRDLSEVATVLDVAAKAGIDAAALAVRMEEPAIKERLKADSAAAVERGLFGVPTFFVEGEMFFGVDHLDFVEEALRA